jgi:hypothetical protein
VDHKLLEVVSDAAGLELEPVPRQPEHARGDRSTRNARHASDRLEVPELVEADDPAEVEQHRAIATSRQTEGDPLLRRVRPRIPDGDQALRDLARALHHGRG